MEALAGINGTWLTAVITLGLGGIGFWIRSTLKSVMTDVTYEIHGLSEKMASEIVAHAHERQVGGVSDQIHQQHVVESSVEHERMIEAIKHLSDQADRQTDQSTKYYSKQTEVLTEIAASLRVR